MTGSFAGSSTSKRHIELSSPESPTQKVGAPPLDKFTTVQHTLPMLSLNNATDPEEMAEFEARIQRFLRSSEPIDYVVESSRSMAWLSSSSMWTDDSPWVPRGDGIRGEDIT